ncbi:amphiphysin-like [Tympanuchus pallidicinctus]|uniref:amphiphysin-like n=1 Tax=Tympanuchus pallidicinctus TaxID=109042 RepID=UPI00228760DD|nr:amphiphysin-like [Tympanuchus pallidicinctus]
MKQKTEAEEAPPGEVKVEETPAAAAVGKEAIPAEPDEPTEQAANIEACEWLRNGVGTQGSNRAMGACVTTFLSGPCKDWHSLGTRSGETVKKAKASAALLRKEAQKESKKNREGLEREGPQDTGIRWNASSEVGPKAAD